MPFSRFSLLPILVDHVRTKAAAKRGGGLVATGVLILEVREVIITNLVESNKQDERWPSGRPRNLGWGTNASQTH